MRFFMAVLALCGAVSLMGCEKEEYPLELPPPEVLAGSFADQVNMGSDYSTQFFYDFATQRAVASSAVASWDMAFDARATGMGVWMNGGMDVAVFPSGIRNFANITALPQGFQFSQWKYDHPAGNPDSTGVGDWRSPTQVGASKTEVYIVRSGMQPKYKFQILSATAQKWTIAWGPLGAQQPIIVELPKDTTLNFVYYSFRDGALVKPEPAKAGWDIVFTRYRDYVPTTTGELFPYVVTGVLLNFSGVQAAADSTSGWENVTAQHAAALPISNARNVIGYDWKSIAITSGGAQGNYSVNPNKVYLIRTQKGKLFKLRFLDFYSQAGEKGSPKFEVQQLQ